MSEGPQVKVKTEWLHRQLAGRRVLACDTSKNELVGLTGEVCGHCVQRVFCKGKHIFIEFAENLFLHNHLLMRGRWRRYDGRLLFLLEGMWLAMYVGPYTIANLNGQMLRVESAETVRQALAKLGPDVMASPYPAEEIARALCASDGPIGPVLLKQSLLCGLGNIAKSEALHVAGIDPRTDVGSLSPERMSALVDAIREVCVRSYNQGGRWECSVYGRHGRNCARCGGRIARLRQAGRTTYFCPGCQR